MSKKLIGGLLTVTFTITSAQASSSTCSQTQVDGTTPPATTSFIYSRKPVQPFYQWENNDGYCGEVSMMQAGLSNGQWMSQFNARLICGTGLSQSGPDRACSAHKNTVNYNAQLLIEDPDTGVTGPNVYADAAQCLANSRLNATTFNYSAQATGMAGYEEYMSWVKAEVIAGHQVTLAVLLNGGTDAQYDHEVSVIKIGTNHSPTDAAYYPDDVVYFDEHGVYTLANGNFIGNPPIPPGAGTEAADCTPFTFGYTVASLARTRVGANRNHAQAYSIVIPGNFTIHTAAGGTGYNTVAIRGPHNYAFSVAGPEDPTNVTLPVKLTIAAPTITNGKQNPLHPVAGYNYENPMIGSSIWDLSCTNQRPASMSHVVLQAEVSGLTPGVAYNLYEYDFSTVEGEGSAAALKIPVRDFNASAAMATRVRKFRATNSTFTQTVTTISDKVVAFRCVPSSAP